MKVTDVNYLSQQEFINLFGNVVECYPKIAKELFLNLPYKNLNDIVEIADEFLENLTPTEKETVLKLHPDLAGKLADEKKLTAESTQEQKAAGLDKISMENKDELNNLNQQYKEKFGFPFVICARENKANAILKGLRHRLNNTKEQELKTGIEEVKKICTLRIKDIIKNN